jgi:hypothetical protein
LPAKNMNSNLLITLLSSVHSSMANRFSNPKIQN